jgi:hypothetical protein
VEARRWGQIRQGVRGPIRGPCRKPVWSAGAGRDSFFTNSKFVDICEFKEDFPPLAKMDGEWSFITGIKNPALVFEELPHLIVAIEINDGVTLALHRC